ncbi:unnamed protein product [Ceutorhynchus assimilis]|uniref:Uncharacterized protein n=1 Tax=Ceutorhynchus assimilis TaxID=467358 RepID=A0A9P0GSC3_9CUCU|nr:unnamed protein product [Ceutorhynchus assimilis]
MNEFQSNAAQNTILNLLAACETNFEFPALQNEAVELISNNITDIVYTSLKQKSTASSTKRCNLLKLLCKISETPESHLTENHYKVYLKQYEEKFCKSNDLEAVVNLITTISKELEDITGSLHKDVLDFYRRKNKRRAEKAKRIEFIQKMDQEKSDMHVPRNISHYLTSESLIDDLLKENQNKNVNESLEINNFNSRVYRQKQAQFCYAIVNIGKDDKKILESVLNKLTTYNLLERFEIRMLTDLWLMGESNNLDLSAFITKKFPFIIEKIILNCCTDILKLTDSAQVSKYFTDLDQNPHIIKLRDVCTKNLAFYCKLKNIIFELYVLSECNENVYRFCDYII